MLFIYINLVWEILSAITDMHHQTGLLQSLYAGSADEYGGGHQGVVTFVFERGPCQLFQLPPNVNKTPSAQWELRERAVHTY